MEAQNQSPEPAQVDAQENQNNESSLPKEPPKMTKSQQFSLENSVRNIWQSVADITTNIGEATTNVGQVLTNTASNTVESCKNVVITSAHSVTNTVEETINQAGLVTKKVTETAQNITQTISNQADLATKNVAETAQNITQTISNQADLATKNVAETAQNITQTISNQADLATKNAAETAQNISDTAVNITKVAGSAVMEAPRQLGNAVDLFSKNPLLKSLLAKIKVDWLADLIDRIDVVSATNYVENLKQEHPDENPRQLSHRIMLEKSLYLATANLVTGLIPGGTVLFAADFAMAATLQGEMIYQIACAYGFDLRDPSRKGEALTVFGVTLGGSYAVKGALELLKVIPVAGAVISASSNAAMLYALGYAACNFYEAKLSSNNTELQLEETQARSEEYLKRTIQQQIIMDQILAHVYLAGYPNKNWHDLLLELDKLSLSPESVKELTKLSALPPIESLLNQVNGDWSVPILAKCEQLINADGIVTPEEEQILSVIHQKLGNKAFSNQTPEVLIGASLLGVLLAILSGERPWVEEDIEKIMADIDQMPGEDFELFLSKCFRRLNYQVETTPKTGDFGADLILTKNGEKIVVQAKRYQGKVGNSAIQEVVAAIAYYQGNRAIVITNSEFTSSAEKLAKANNVKLWNRKQLIDLVKLAKSK